MKANAVWIEGFKSELENGRGHRVVVDLPIEQGRKDSGPSALELAVMALAGCVTTIFKVIAEKRKFDYKYLKVELDADKPKEATTIATVRGHVELITNGSEKEAQTILSLKFNTSPVGVLFEKAGIKVDYDLTLKKTVLVTNP